MPWLSIYSISMYNQPVGQTPYFGLPFNLQSRELRSALQETLSKHKGSKTLGLGPQAGVTEGISPSDMGIGQEVRAMGRDIRGIIF